MYAVLCCPPSSDVRAGATLTELDATGSITAPTRQLANLAAEVALLDQRRLRWVWDETSIWYPELLRAGVRVERCVDLRLSHAILRRSALTAASALATGPVTHWDRPTPERPTRAEALFDVEVEARTGAGAEVAADLGEGPGDSDVLREFARQLAAIASAPDPARIGLLLAAESAGALIAAEMRFAGLPWRSNEHDRILTEALGPRPAGDTRPAKMQATLERVRGALTAPQLNPDSPAELLKALGRAGIHVESTRSWELRKLKHPAIEPLLEYKRMARLLSANGWNWLDANVAHGRFHPDYVPGGVVTGRWASKGGGGALQLPQQVRGAVIADRGWKLVVADAAQLEPRILAALSADRGMVEAGRSGDIYAGIVARGAVTTRQQAKGAMLGAMYGATSGDAGRLLPRLAQSYPRAIAFVEEAARAGERGDIVTTRLGRSSPRGEASGYDETATEAEVGLARSRARSWGRFTRNFVVQGTAAEWALCWMAGLRGRLDSLTDSALFTAGPHLVFFLHDEVVVHCPAELADRVEREVRAAATDAGRLLFGALPVDFPLTVSIVDDYGQAK